MIIAATVFLCLSFIAQVLLCAIFWDLGRKKEKQEESEEEFTEVTLEAWDEDAELQMRIWNSFLREQKQVSSLISDGSNSLVLSTERISSYKKGTNSLKQSSGINKN